MLNRKRVKKVIWTLPLLMLFLILANTTIADCPPDCNVPMESIPVDYPDFTDYQTWESADQAVWLTENYDSDYALAYYSDFTNIGQSSEVDAQYFSDFSNYAENPEAFDSFFTGTYASEGQIETLRENFKEYPDSAASYLSEKYGSTYTISKGEDGSGVLAGDFEFIS